MLFIVFSGLNVILYQILAGMKNISLLLAKLALKHVQYGRAIENPLELL